MTTISAIARFCNRAYLAEHGARTPEPQPRPAPDPHALRCSVCREPVSDGETHVRVWETGEAVHWRCWGRA